MLSETAFVYRPDAGGVRRLRWFTPVAEVPLCGHATLASAHVLIRELGVAPPVRFESASGLLIVHESGSHLVMDLPANPAAEAPMPEGLAKALGVDEARPARLRRLEQGGDRGAALRGGRCGHPARLRCYGPGRSAPRRDGGRRDGPRVRLVRRFRVTLLRARAGGSTRTPLPVWPHTTLAPWWAAVLEKREMSARQRSARGGKLVARVLGDRVELAGQAVTVARGTMVPPGLRSLMIPGALFRSADRQSAEMSMDSSISMIGDPLRIG